MAAKKKEYKKMSAATKKMRAKIFKEIRQKTNQRRKELFDATTLEQRKEFIKLVHSNLTVGKVAEHANMSIDTATEILRRNIKTIKHNYIVAVEDVK